MGVFQKYRDKNRNKTGPWFIKYPISRDPLTDKLIYKVEKTGYSKKTAERLFQKMVTEFHEDSIQKSVINRNLRFYELIDWYLNLESVQKKKSYRKIRESCDILKRFFENVKVINLKPHMVEDFMFKMLDSVSKSGNKYSPASVNRVFTVLKRMFNLALREEMVLRNPCIKVSQLPEENIRDRILSYQELQRLLKYLPPHTQLIVKTGYFTGMRIGEILNLTWDRVNLKDGSIYLGFSNTKTREPRTVYLNSELMDVFKEASRVRSLEHNYVFTYKGKPIKSIKTSFQNACRKARIENFRFHDLRHTFNTNMRKAGVDKTVIMKLTGHKTISMFQRYNTVDQDDAKTAMERLDDFIRRNDEMVPR